MAERLRRLKEEVLGIISVFGSVYLGLSLFSYSKWDPSFFTFAKTATRNYGGVVGAYLSDFLISLIGLSAVVLPLFLLVFGIKRVLGREKRKIYLLGAFLFVVSGSTLASLLRATFHFIVEVDAGGMLGYSLSTFLEKYVSVVGAYIFSLSGFFSSLILLSPVSLTSLAVKRTKTRPAPKPQKAEKPFVEEEILIREPEKKSEALVPPPSEPAAANSDARNLVGLMSSMLE